MLSVPLHRSSREDLIVRTDIRNIAIIAHVDHGKTTLVDAMFRQSGIFRANQKVEERVLDQNDLERERGITILAKNTSVRFGGVKVNIVDTPGHADFGGEVERVLSMVDGALLVVDAAEGPMPQTRYVLRKAFEAKLRPVVFINKIDRRDARPRQVEDEVLDLFIALGADEDQLDYPTLFGSGKAGTASLDPDRPGEDLRPLFEAILAEVPSPAGDPGAPLRLLVSSIDSDPYQGRVVIGRVRDGAISPGMNVRVGRALEELRPAKVSRVYIYDGLEKREEESVEAGDIVAVTGIAEVNIGDSVLAEEGAEPLPSIAVDEPTLQMVFRVNDSPLAGREGKYVTSRHIRERLLREAEKNVALRVEETESPDAFLVSGRGELHLSILIETMRREGYEMQVAKPEVIRKVVDGEVLEPYEELVVDIPEEYLGPVMEHIGSRKGELLEMTDGGQGSRRLQFRIPARGLIGLRQEVLGDTRGHAIMHNVFFGYGEDKGPIITRHHGSLIASETGVTTTYALHHLADRGVFFLTPQTEVYAGQVVGEHTREKDLELNPCKKRHVTNVRSATAEETLRPGPSHILTLEEAIEFLADDEYLEITPKNLRVRKMVLDPHQRVRESRQKSAVLLGD